MGFWARLFKRETAVKPAGQSKDSPIQEIQKDLSAPDIRYEDIPGTLDLGWYYSPDKDEFQMAKVAQKDRATHFYVIGATGTGKTKFLEFLIQQDINQGNGFGVIDPHGDLIEDIKGFLACRFYSEGNDAELAEKLVLIDPTDPHYTVTFNPLEKLSNVSTAEQAAELIGAFRKIWSDSWGVRMEDLMRNSLIALGEAELTLAELPYFLTNRRFRKAVVETLTHPIAQDYFHRFETLTDRGQVTWIEPVMNKVNAFLSDERLRQMFAAPQSSFNLREIMDNKKMLLIKLDKGKLKGSADLLGSLLMAKIQLAAFSRSDMPQSKRTPFYLYIDEFQNFASESFAVILSEARKYGLSLIMAHQTLAQIPGELQSLILGNTGLQVCFRVNRHDAQVLAKEAFEYSGFEVKTVRSRHPVFWSLGEEWENHTNELQTLPPRVCYVKHKIEGGIIPIQTEEIEPAYQALALPEDEYEDFLKSLPFGMDYLADRDKLAAQTDQRAASIREKIKEKAKERVEERGTKEAKPIEIPIEPSLKEDQRPALAKAMQERAESKSPKTKVDLPPSPQPKTESQHRYLQTLIKKMAEEIGYRAIIEQPTPDGLGRVDVSLEQDGQRKIACEISITTNEEQELGNIKKCLAAGYEQVILCSPDKKTLKKVKSLATKQIEPPDLEKVLFLKPEELVAYLEEMAASKAGKEEKVKGYKVKVQYQPVADAEKKTKREAVASVIFQAFRRLEGGKPKK